MKTNTQIVLETLDQINVALKRDPNALTCTRGGSVAPEQAYLELVRELLALTKQPGRQSHPDPMKSFIIVSRRDHDAQPEHYAFGTFKALAEIPPDGRGTIRHPLECIDAKLAEFRRLNPRRIDITAIPV